MVSNEELVMEEHPEAADSIAVKNAQNMDKGVKIREWLEEGVMAGENKR